MNILWMTSSLPYPPITGARIRVLNLLKCIAERHQVTLLSLIDSAEETRLLPELQPYCAQIVTVVKQRRRPRGKLLLRLLWTMLKGQPVQNGIAYYEPMKRKVQELVSPGSFDIVHIEQSHIAPYVEFMPAERTARLITLYDVGGIQLERIFKVQSSFKSRLWTWLDWSFLRRWEPAYIARHFDKCIVVSPVDEASLRRANPALDLAVVPNGVNTCQYTPLPEADESKDLLFVGKMSYAPNVDSALFFYREVLPLIQSQVPQARLLIVGTSPDAQVQALAADPRVQVTGHVQDIVPYYQRACVSVVPLRAGSGTRLKILESMALGRPVVSTSLGCEGLAVTPGQDILVADTPADFAAQTVRLMTDGELRRHLIVNGRRLVETTYDWHIIAEQLLHVYGQVASRKKQ